MREQTAVKTPQSDSPAATGLLQRKCACGQHTTDQHGQCTECNKKGQLLQRRAINQSGPEIAPPIVHQVLRSPGRPLDAATRTDMEPRFGHDFSRIPAHTGGPTQIQAKLTINKPGDKYEQEADRIADQVMRMPDPVAQRQAVLEEEEEDETLQMKPLATQITPLVQREAIDEEEEEEEEIALQRQPLMEEELLQAKGDAQAPTATSSAEAAVQSVRQGGGRPLDPATQAFMEPRFGHDFGNVRVHTDSRAASAAEAVNARAFTIGQDIVFGSGEYKPSADKGQRLMAHELAHTVQQTAQETRIAPVLQRRALTFEERRQGSDMNDWSLRFVPKGDPIVELEEIPKMDVVTFNNGPHLEVKAKRFRASSEVMTRGDDDVDVSDWDVGFHQTIHADTDLILCYSRPDPNADPRGSGSILEPEIGMITQNIGELAGGPVLDGDIEDKAPFINPPKMARLPSPTTGVVVSMNDRPQTKIPIFLNNDRDRGACLTQAIRVFHATAFVIAERRSDHHTVYVNHIDWGFRQSVHPGAIALRDPQQIDLSNVGNFSMHYAAFPFRIGAGKGLRPSVLTPPFANTIGGMMTKKELGEPCPSTGVGCIPDPRSK
jgi:hypothetical protein